MPGPFPFPIQEKALGMRLSNTETDQPGYLENAREARALNCNTTGTLTQYKSSDKFETKYLTPKIGPYIELKLLKSCNIKNSRL